MQRLDHFRCRDVHSPQLRDPGVFAVVTMSVEIVNDCIQPFYQRPKGLSAIPPSAFQHGHLLPRPTRTAAMMIPASLPLLDGSEEGRAVLAEVRGSSRECWLFDTKCLGLCSAHTWLDGCCLLD